MRFDCEPMTVNREECVGLDKLQVSKPTRCLPRPSSYGGCTREGWGPMWFLACHPLAPLQYWAALNRQSLWSGKGGAAAQNLCLPNGHRAFITNLYWRT
jgi:hypothetical protein